MREIVLDTETTGLDPLRGDRLVEIGCVEIFNRMPTGQAFHRYFNPEREMSAEAFAVHGLSTEFLADKPFFAEEVDEFLAFIGGLAGEGSATDWVANHRKHHAHSDQEGDPHSPHDGPWWSHIFWLAFWKGPKAHDEHIRHWAPDLMKDPVLRWIGYMFLPSHFVLAAVLAIAKKPNL